MSPRASIEGFQQLQKKLNEALKKAAKSKDVWVRIGYSAAYAIYVEFNMEAKHTNGQALFLTTALVEGRQTAQRMIAKQAKAGGDLLHAMLAAGEHIKVLSQSKCPVASGELRASAFVEASSGS